MSKPKMVKELKALYPREYVSWQEMRRRVFNPRPHQRKSYAGVTICPQWDSFACFVKDMGPRPTPTHTLERRNGNKGYEPRNCTWATRREQVLNRRVTTPLVDYDFEALAIDGETKTLDEWSLACGIPRKILYQRITCYYWTPLEAIQTPLGKKPGGKTDFFRAGRVKLKKTQGKLRNSQNS